MIRGSACSILKVKSDSSVAPPGFSDECCNGVQLLITRFHRHSSFTNWEDNTTQLELPFVVESQKSIGKPESGLSYMQAAFFATALEDFLTSIRVIGDCQSTIRRMKTNIDMDKLVAKKYGVADSPFAADELAGITKDNIGCEEFKLQKLVNDRFYMERVAMETYKELSVDRSYLQLLNAINEFETKIQRNASMKEEELRNRTLRKKLRRQLRVEQNMNAAHMESYSTNVDKVRQQLEEAHLISNIKGRFLNRWQNSRTEQQEESIRRQEKDIAEKIGHYKMKQEEEARVHGEMELFVGIVINEMLVEVENLMTKYEQDVEAMDLKIQKRRLMYEEMVAKRLNLEHLVAYKREKIHIWSSFKESRIRRREYEKKMHAAASVIQAWWRGLLVRHQLGPYHHKGKKGKRRKRSSIRNAAAEV